MFAESITQLAVQIMNKKEIMLPDLAGRNFRGSRSKWSLGVWNGQIPEFMKNYLTILMILKLNQR